MLTRVEGTGESSLFKGDPRLKDTGMDSWYQEMLKESGPAKARPYLYGADAGLCARRNVLLEHNEWIASNKSATTIAYMKIGVALEEMLVSALKRAGRLVASQLPLPKIPEVKVNGYIDMVVFDSEDELALVEVKTCGKLPSAISPTHLAQIQFYAAASGLHKAWVTYISRNVREEFGNELAIRTFPVDCGEAQLKARILTAVLSRLASDEHRLPPVPAHFRKHTECHYCEFRDFACWRERPGLGGRPPISPLPELSPSQMAQLDATAQETANAIQQASRLRFSSLLLELEFLVKDLSLRERLKTLKESELAGFIAGTK